MRIVTVALLLVASGPGLAHAEPAAPGPRTPAEVAGIERRALEQGAEVRALADTLLWVPRSAVDLLFLTTGTAAGLVENEQIVPRAHDFFFSEQAGGEIGVFPTAFIETSAPLFNVGARFVAYAPRLATTLRAGYGGPDANVVESRLRFVASTSVPAVFSLEGYHDRRTEISFLGVGQSPLTDPRNHFLSEPRAGIYRERRERLIAGFGLRPLANVEMLASASLTQRYTSDDPDEPVDALTSVLAPESAPGFGVQTRVAYEELALRFDSRSSRAAVVTGALLEGYAGAAQGVGTTNATFYRTGGRAAAFLPVFRSTTILSPRIVVDTLMDSNDSPIPFTELVSQSTFRGFNNRHDRASVVGSLDYRWQLVQFVAARWFFDVARVAPSLAQFGFDELRYAGGFGLELHSRDSELGRIAIAASSDGVSFLFSLGVPAGFGDRQHRD